MKHELLPLAWNDLLECVSLWAQSFTWARRTHSPSLRPSSTLVAIHPTQNAEKGPGLDLLAQDEIALGIWDGPESEKHGDLLEQGRSTCDPDEGGKDPVEITPDSRVEDQNSLIMITISGATMKNKKTAPPSIQRLSLFFCCPSMALLLVLSLCAEVV